MVKSTKLKLPESTARSQYKTISGVTFYGGFVLRAYQFQTISISFTKFSFIICLHNQGLKFMKIYYLIIHQSIRTGIEICTRKRKGTEMDEKTKNNHKSNNNKKRKIYINQT